MKAFEFADVMDEWQGAGRPYFEFIKEPSLSMGLYVLPAGGVDRQTPHAEDEVYYIIAGAGVLNVAGEDRTVGTGSIVFVEKRVEHFFHLITEDLRILVFITAAKERIAE